MSFIAVVISGIIKERIIKISETFDSSLPVNPQKVASLTFLSTSCVDDGRGSKDSFAYLNKIPTSSSSDANKDYPSASFSMVEWNVVKKYCDLMASTKTSFVMNSMQDDNWMVQRCKSLHVDSFGTGMLSSNLEKSEDIGSVESMVS